MAEENKTQENNGKGKTAVVNGTNIKLSTKQAIAICKMIKGKTIEQALKMLEEVTQFKRVIKMNTMEVGHRHGKGIMAGRYPINSCKEFIRLVKQLNANALANEIDVDEMVIACHADMASRPYRRDGRKGKRSHLTLMLEKPKIKNLGKKIKTKA